MSSRGTIRVLVTGPSLSGQGAGIQQHVRTLIDAFPRCSDFEVVPFAVTSARYHESWLWKIIRSLGVLARFPLAVRGFDVVHINSTLDRRSVIRDTMLLQLAILFGKPVVFQFHGGGLHRLHGCSGAIAKRAGRALRSASRVLFLSRSQGEPAVAEFGLERILYVRNYVDVHSFEPASQRCSSAKRPLRVTFLGRLDAEKGAGELIDAFGLMPEREWRLSIAGSGPLAQKATQAAEADERIEYLGFIDAQSRSELLADSDILCLPSAHDEGLPYAVLEAAASSCALVTSSKGALAEVTLDGRTGRVIPARDPRAIAVVLAEMDDDEESLEGMQAEARRLMERHFDIESLRQTLGDVWREAVDQDRSD